MTAMGSVRGLQSCSKTRLSPGAAGLSVTFLGDAESPLPRTAMLDPVQEADGAANPDRNSTPQSSEL